MAAMDRAADAGVQTRNFGFWSAVALPAYLASTVNIGTPVSNYRKRWSTKPEYSGAGLRCGAVDESAEKNRYPNQF